MSHCAATSPLYRAWLDTVPVDLQGSKDAKADLATHVSSAPLKRAAKLAGSDPVISEHLADAYIFISRPPQTVAVRPEDEEGLVESKASAFARWSRTVRTR